MKFVSMPDQAVEGALHRDDDVDIALTLLVVLVVDLTEELGDRFLLRAEGGTERGTGWPCIGSDEGT